MTPNQDGLEKSFEKTDVERLLGIKTTRLQEWLKFQYIDADAPGQGYKYTFDFFDLCSILFLENLIAQGFTRVYAGETTKYMRKHVRSKNLIKTPPNYFAFGEQLSKERPKRRTGLKIREFNDYKKFDLAKFSKDFDHVFIFDFLRVIDQVKKAISG